MRTGLIVGFAALLCSASVLAAPARAESICTEPGSDLPYQVSTDYVYGETSEVEVPWKVADYPDFSAVTGLEFNSQETLSASAIVVRDGKRFVSLPSDVAQADHNTIRFQCGETAYRDAYYFFATPETLTIEKPIVRSGSDPFQVSVIRETKDVDDAWGSDPDLSFDNATVSDAGSDALRIDITGGTVSDHKVRVGNQGAKGWYKTHDTFTVTPFGTGRVTAALYGTLGVRPLNFEWLAEDAQRAGAVCTKINTSRESYRYASDASSLIGSTLLWTDYTANDVKGVEMLVDGQRLPVEITMRNAFSTTQPDLRRGPDGDDYWKVRFPQLAKTGWVDYRFVCGAPASLPDDLGTDATFLDAAQTQSVSAVYRIKLIADDAVRVDLPTSRIGAQNFSVSVTSDMDFEFEHEPNFGGPGNAFDAPLDQIPRGAPIPIVSNGTLVAWRAEAGNMVENGARTGVFRRRHDLTIKPATAGAVTVTIPGPLISSARSEPLRIDVPAAAP